MKDKKGIELAISTLILIILGIAVLIALIGILVFGWGNFRDNIGAILGSDVSQARKTCEIQCSLDNDYDFCCGKKMIKDSVYKCSDELLKSDCTLDCGGIICMDEDLDVPPMPN